MSPHVLEYVTILLWKSIFWVHFDRKMGAMEKIVALEFVGFSARNAQSVRNSCAANQRDETLLSHAKMHNNMLLCWKFCDLHDTSSRTWHVLCTEIGISWVLICRRDHVETSFGQSMVGLQRAGGSFGNILTARPRR
jgi:hypothetical protein